MWRDEAAPQTFVYIYSLVPQTILTIELCIVHLSIHVLSVLLLSNGLYTRFMLFTFTPDCSGQVLYTLFMFTPD